MVLLPLVYIVAASCASCVEISYDARGVFSFPDPRLLDPFLLSDSGSVTILATVVHLKLW
jgi:hypothetical protein